MMIKTCKNCGESLNIDKFYLDKRSKDGHIGTCKFCILKKKYYNRAREDRKIWFQEYKRKCTCSICGTEGYDFPELIVFHHNNKTGKDRTVSRLVSGGYSKIRILNEIKKCIPLCVNCHIILHAERNRHNGLG